MKKNILLSTLFMALAMLSACKEDDEVKDTTPPEIGGDAALVNPIDCQVYHPGDVLKVYYVLTDDMELGSYEIEVHDNFQPHTHSAVAVHCPHLSSTATVYPWTFVEAFEIPEGQTRYIIEKQYTIPDDRDLGDYHLEIRVTDRTGWTTEKSIDIKIYAPNTPVDDNDGHDDDHGDNHDSGTQQ
ncbi:MAG: DUF4625 domain-containing protein [Bacteroidales bacterium]|nr:DUF4625 domain-containing protein [Bacteroidales bacterium]